MSEDKTKDLNMTGPEKQVDKKAEAIKVLQQEEQESLKKCSEEVGAALQKYGYELNIQQTIVLKKVR